jgi:hypothetical protein
MSLYQVQNGERIKITCEDHTKLKTVISSNY